MAETRNPNENAPAAPGAAAPPVAPADDKLLPQSALFFISYSRKNDLAHAQKLNEALRSLGVAEEQIWIDRDTLEPGDVYTQQILDGIRNCRYFLPIVSRAATQREKAFVFREWDEATDQLREMNRKYLVPLVVDADNVPESYDQASVRAWRERKINFGHAPGGVPDDTTREFIKGLLREARTRS